MGAISNAYAWLAKSDAQKLDHYMEAIENCYIVLECPDKYCVSGKCDSTNWGGMDRLHLRGSDCPAFVYSEVWSDLESAKKSYDALDKRIKGC